MSRSILPLLLLCATLPACGEPPADTKAPNYDRKLAVQQDYRPPQGWQTECVGYHLIDLPGPIEVAIGGSPGFEKNLFTRGDLIDIGEAWVKVVEARDLTHTEFVKLANSTEARDANVRDLQEKLKDRQERLQEAIHAKQRSETDPNHVENPENPTPTESDIRISREQVKQMEDWIQESLAAKATWIDHDSFLWANESVQVLRPPYLYEFSFKKHTSIEEARAFVQRFQTRKLGEIPPEAGFCIPFGFIRGVSGFPYNDQTTFRVKGEPGVLYTVKFKTNVDGSEGVATDVAVKGLAGLMGKLQTKTLVLPMEWLPVGPYQGVLTGFHAKPYKETKLPDGRIRIERRDKKSQPYIEIRKNQGEIYHVDAGFSGLADDLMVPAVAAELNGFAYDADPIMNNQPAKSLEATLPDFKRFIASVRLREENARALRDQAVIKSSKTQ
ncbi:hypothetical protein [Jeongeupia chitinilytica]|uniref:Tle cognate immunity protein 4 C-terminal domain-containing protein n=1 Tax=Jeongeupia chitinilytica TaxID=1041641 RepID=A0ABQ3GYM4_9NEIS|nr:hypothetical protein [Jeongeupia chitinilytica]GHD57806.1 hypothetical protein GCM10007350_06660 [Jeongeupia chitinilytica]